MITGKLTAISAAIFLVTISNVNAKPSEFCGNRYCGQFREYRWHVHKHHKHVKLKAHALKKPKPVQVSSLGNELIHEAPTGLVEQASRYLGMTARQVGVRSSLWCSAFIRKLTHAAGVDDRAISWLRKPKVNAAINTIAVMSHHVGIVMSISKNYVVLISGNHGHKVGIGKYPRSRIIAYVSA